MNMQEFKKWARQLLGEDGECTVKVELTDNQLEVALNRAKQWFNAFVGLHKETTLSIVEGQSIYDLSSVSPGIEDVMKVYFPRRATEIDFTVLYPGFLDVEGIPYGVGTLWGTGYPQTTITQTMQALESNGKMFSADLDWQFYRDNFTTPVTRELRVMPAPAQGGTAFYLYRVDPKDINLEHYDARHLWLIQEWALAEAKIMLGRIRGKYSSGLPAAGGERTLDGEALIAEAREDKERLEEKVLDFQGPVMPMVY